MITPDSEIDGYYKSSHGGWDFSIDEDTLEVAEDAVAAWTEWLSYLHHRKRVESEKALF